MGSWGLTTEPKGLERRAALILVFAGVMAAVFIFELPFCPLAYFAKTPCPGCGLSRASFAMLQGDFQGALALHPLVFVVSPLAMAIVALNVGSYLLRGRLFEMGPRAKWLEGLLLAVAVSMLLVWVARFFGAFGGPVAV